MARRPNFEFLEHMADIKFVARGSTPSQVFENAARAVSSYIAGGTKVRAHLVAYVDIRGTDYESLLYAFLDELLYFLDAEGFLIACAEVSIENFTARVVLHGDSAKGYDIRQVKAATYAEMYLKETMKGWEAQVVLDV